MTVASSLVNMEDYYTYHCSSLVNMQQLYGMPYGVWCSWSAVFKCTWYLTSNVAEGLPTLVEVLRVISL